MEAGVIVCGFGHVGYRIALLLRRLGLPVSVIYDQAPADWTQHAASLGIACHKGDARDGVLLEKAGIRTAQAVIAATDHDMTNLSVAMDARRLNPGMVIVVRLFDTLLAPHFEAALGLRKALSASSIAAPVFASAAMGNNVAGCFSAAGRSYTLSEIVVSRESPWVGMSWGDIARREGPSALFQVPDDAGVAAGVDPGTSVIPGQRVMLLRESIAPTSDSSKRKAAAPLSARVRNKWNNLRGLWKDITPTVKGVMAALAVITIAGTFTFHHFLKMAPIDAFYFVVTTISTTGYGDYSLRNSSPWLKLFGCFVMLSGAALMAIVFSVVTDRLIKARFRRFVAKPDEVEHPHMIVVGQNSIARRVAEELYRVGLPVVVLAPPSEERLDIPHSASYPILAGDPRSDTGLTAAGIATADAVLALTEDDVLNLGVALQAKTMNPGTRTVIRTFDADLGAKLQAQLDSAAVISASAVSAPTFAACALCSDVIHATVWRDHLIVAQITGPQPAPALTGCVAVYSHPSSARAPRASHETRRPATALDETGLRISALRLRA